MTLFQLTRLAQNVAGSQRIVDSDICWIFGFFELYIQRTCTTFPCLFVPECPRQEALTVLPHLAATTAACQLQLRQLRPRKGAMTGQPSAMEFGTRLDRAALLQVASKPSQSG